MRRLSIRKRTRMVFNDRREPSLRQVLRMRGYSRFHWSDMPSYRIRDFSPPEGYRPYRSRP